MREHTLVRALLGLTFVTGLVDAVSVLGLGRVFTANMTGNVVFLGFAAAGAPGLSFARSGMALAAFLLGAVTGGRLATRVGAERRRRPTALAFGAEAALLFTASLTAIGREPTSRKPRRGSTPSSCSPAWRWARGMRSCGGSPSRISRPPCSR